jgi:hypothetical protein
MRFHTFCFISAAPTAAVRRKQQQALSCFRACATTTKQWFSLLSLSLFIKVARRQRERVFPRFFFFVCFSRVKGTHKTPLTQNEKKKKVLLIKKRFIRERVNMGGKTELTTIKTLMEITGQNKEDVQNVLQKFGGDEDLAVSELMNSACLRVNEIFFFFFVF